MISVVVPVRNAKPYIEPCIRNLEDVFANFEVEHEIVFVDGGSVDGTATELQTWAKNRKNLLICEDLNGLASARNVGIARSRGDWIMVHDVDDIAHPQKLASLFGSLSRLSDDSRNAVALLASSAVIADGEDRILALHPFAEGLRKCAELDIGDNLLMHGAVVMKRSLLNAVGGYKEGLRFEEDFELWRRIGKMQPDALFWAIEEPLYWYRIRKGSASSLQMHTFANNTHGGVKKTGIGIWSVTEREVIKRLVLEGRRQQALAYAGSSARLKLPVAGDLKQALRLALGRAPDWFLGYLRGANDPFLREFQKYARSRSPGGC